MQVIETLGTLKGGAIPYGSKGIPFSRIERLWHEGLTLSEIAWKLGCSPTNICNRVKKSRLYDKREIERRQRAAISHVAKQARARGNPMDRPEIRRKIGRTLKLLHEKGIIQIGKGSWFPKGNIPWNKGLTKDIDERMRRIAEGMRGENNHMFGRGGEEHPNWRGGHEPYYGPNWLKQRRKTLERDHHICQVCGAPENGKEHDVHHIIPFKEFGLKLYQEANRLKNLATLCHRCHTSLEWLEYKNKGEPDVDEADHQIHPQPVDVVF